MREKFSEKGLDSGVYAKGIEDFEHTRLEYTERCIVKRWFTDYKRYKTTQNF
jgi:hypothetical protein